MWPHRTLVEAENTTMAVPSEIHIPLGFGILADVSIFETGLGRFGLVIFTN